VIDALTQINFEKDLSRKARAREVHCGKVELAANLVFSAVPSKITTSPFEPEASSEE